MRLGQSSDLSPSVGTLFEQSSNLDHTHVVDALFPTDRLVITCMHYRIHACSQRVI